MTPTSGRLPWTFPSTDDPYRTLVTATRGSVALRFRWVWPGALTMGGVQAGRTSHDETPHEVTLTGGSCLGLGDAPATQDVWESVIIPARSFTRGDADEDRCLAQPPRIVTLPFEVTDRSKNDVGPRQNGCRR